jgi:hypothetical protein
MCVAPGHHNPDDVRLVRRLAMGWQLRPLPWGTICGQAGLQSRLVDGIQHRCVSLVLQESARRVEGEFGLVEYVYVSESAAVGKLPI